MPAPAKGESDDEAEEVLAFEEDEAKEQELVEQGRVQAHGTVPPYHDKESFDEWVNTPLVYLKINPKARLLEVC